MWVRTVMEIPAIYPVQTEIEEIQLTRSEMTNEI